MTLKRHLLFTGQCLTLELFPDRISSVRDQIRKGNINWETLVSVSSGYLVLPAMFVQLERAGLSEELPADLVQHFQDLTSKNRTRNQQIIQQAIGISKTLNREGIAPTFLKGSAHLLLPLYTDPAERLVGDIDFLVPEKDLQTAVNLLLAEGYEAMGKFYPDMIKTVKHFPRLVNFNHSAAAEVHIRVLKAPHDRRLRAEDIDREKQRLGTEPEMYCPSFRHLVIHNALNAQVNDKSWLSGYANLRQLYDLMMLSGKTNVAEQLSAYPFYQNRTRAWLSMSSLLLGFPERDQYTSRLSDKIYTIPLSLVLNEHKKTYRIYATLLYLLPRLFRYVILPIKAIYRKDYRDGLKARLSDPKWFSRHLKSYKDYFKRNR